MSTQLMGGLQLGGSIIGMFLGLTQEVSKSWAPMEEMLGVHQRAIGKGMEAQGALNCVN